MPLLQLLYFTYSIFGTCILKQFHQSIELKQHFNLYIQLVYGSPDEKHTSKCTHTIKCENIIGQISHEIRILKGILSNFMWSCTRNFGQFPFCKTIMIFLRDTLGEVLLYTRQTHLKQYKTMKWIVCPFCNVMTDNLKITKCP